MGKDPDAIRREIEETREGMAGTVDALAYKGDVKNRTKDKVRGLAQKPKDAVLSVKENVFGKVQDHTPDRQQFSSAKDATTGKLSSAKDATTGAITKAPGQVADGAKRVGGVMRENPVGLAVGGLAVGFIAGLVLPSTRMENEKLGPLSDQLKDSVKESGQEMLEHGKELAQTAAGAAQDAVKEDAPEHAKDVASSAGDKAKDVRSTVGASSGSNSQF